MKKQCKGIIEQPVSKFRCLPILLMSCNTSRGPGKIMWRFQFYKYRIYCIHFRSKLIHFHMIGLLKPTVHTPLYNAFRTCMHVIYMMIVCDSGLECNMPISDIQPLMPSLQAFAVHIHGLVNKCMPHSLNVCQDECTGQP